MYSSQSQMASGLMRYRSAPSSFLESLVSGGEEFQHPAPENLMGRFFSGDSSCLTSESSCRVTVSPPATAPPDLEEIEPGRPEARPPPPPPPVEEDLKKSQGFGSGSGFCESEIVFQGGGGGGGGAAAGAGSSGGGFSPLGHMGVGGFATSSNFKSSLTRRSSSPAGFLANLHLENGYSLGGGIGGFSLDNCSNGQHGVTQRRLKSQLSFSRQDSPKGLMSQLSDINMAEVGETITGNSSSDDGSLGSGNATKSYMSSGFPLGSWDDSHPIVFGSAPRKRGRDLNGEIIHGFSDTQFGLAKTPIDMVSMEKYLQIQQDAVPCKIRAKRGCATHPRSIAERERRTRISEKLRKLQELVPNMDKQTNTADMLDLAVQYIKSLQNDVQTLTQERGNCTCSSKQEAKS
ncbi:transcription factor bHLH128-like [Nymphaea colorata]|nr:transcription factor bHLH128-like [Nymphaea colorata]